MKSFTLNTHIAQVFMMACSLFAAVVGYLNRKKHINLGSLYLYPLASFIQAISYYIVVNLSLTRKIQNDILYITCNLFLVIELYLIYHFFLKTLANQSAKKLLYLIQTVYIVVVCLYWSIYSTFLSMPTTFYIIQAFCVLIPALLYFFELFKWPQTDNLLKVPSFWIVTGVTVYFAGTLPLFVMMDFIFGRNRFIKEPTLYLINFVAYSIMFLFITKAYLCPKRDTP